MIEFVLSQAKELEFDRNGHLGMIIFEFLSYLSDEDLAVLSKKIASMFPDNSEISDFKPFKQHLHTSFMRKIFGLSCRNGSLLNLTHPKRVEDYQLNCSMFDKWKFSFKFILMLENEFIQQNKQLGIILVHEALGHRYGDLAEIDKENLILMKEHYCKSFEAAKLIKCSKQLYVVWFWMGCYYYRNAKYDLASAYLLKFNSSLIKYQKVARAIPSDKIKLSFQILRKICTEEEIKSNLSLFVRSSKGKLHRVYNIL